MQRASIKLKPGGGRGLLGGNVATGEGGDKADKNSTFFLSCLF